MKKSIMSDDRMSILNSIVNRTKSPFHYPLKYFIDNSEKFNLLEIDLNLRSDLNKFKNVLKNMLYLYTIETLKNYLKCFIKFELISELDKCMNLTNLDSFFLDHKNNSFISGCSVYYGNLLDYYQIYLFVFDDLLGFTYY
jgi:hypothetical protein